MMFNKDYNTNTTCLEVLRLNTEKIANYIAIKNEMEQMIHTGQFKVGQKLPSETDMAKRFNVSRETFRSSIRLLEQAGKVIIKHGVGTFITNPLPMIPCSLETLTKITDLIENANLTEDEQQDFTNITTCTPEWADKLQIEQNSLVVFHQRIRMANHEPVVLSQNIMPKDLVKDAFEKKPLTGSLTEFLENECQIKTMLSDTELTVPLHTDPLSQKLLIHPNTTVLLMKQIHYDEFNSPVMYSCDYFRNDIFSFHVRRTRNA